MDGSLSYDTQRHQPSACPGRKRSHRHQTPNPPHQVSQAHAGIGTRPSTVSSSNGLLASSQATHEGPLCSCRWSPARLQTLQHHVNAFGTAQEGRVAREAVQSQDRSRWSRSRLLLEVLQRRVHNQQVCIYVTLQVLSNFAERFFPVKDTSALFLRNNTWIENFNNSYHSFRSLVITISWDKDSCDPSVWITPPETLQEFLVNYPHPLFKIVQGDASDYFFLHILQLISIAWVVRPRSTFD